MSYFAQVSDKVKFEGIKTKNKFAFRHYNPNETVNGRTMKEQLRFAICYWHTMTNDGQDPFGIGTNQRTWRDNNPMIQARNRVEAFFELLVKLDVEYFCFHDLDIAPEGDSLQEFYNNLDEITDLIAKKMQETGIKLLWNTANMFTNPRYTNGAGSTCDADVYTYAAAQVKKGLDIAKKLNAENYVFWGGREGYENFLNTDMKLEEENIARLFKMAIAYAKKIGHYPQFLIEPKPKEPSKHQYDVDAATTLAFLRKYGLEKDFKLNIENNHATLAGHSFEHELNVSRINGVLGSIDANQGDVLLGWDTDEFPTNLMETALAMYEILENGGIAPGGVNFDAKVRRSSFEMEDLVLAHIAGMDTYARGLKIATKLKEDKFFDKIKEERYKTFTTGIGASILANKEDLESLTKHALGLKEIKIQSSHIEYYKSLLNDYLYV